MKNYWPNKQSVKTSDMVEKSGAQSRNQFIRFLHKHTDIKPELEIGGTTSKGTRNLFYNTEKASRAVDLFKKWKDSGDVENYTLTSLKDRLEIIETRIKKNNDVYKKDTKDVKNSLGTHAQGIRKIEGLLQRVDTQSNEINRVHHSAQSQLEKQAKLINEQDKQIEKLENIVDQLKEGMQSQHVLIKRLTTRMDTNVNNINKLKTYVPTKMSVNNTTISKKSRAVDKQVGQTSYIKAGTNGKQ